ncbi:MAG: dipeptide epimerase [Pirellulales bacterium]|nr:dipeptide epimerase [Pirellulales bacterium]
MASRTRRQFLKESLFTMTAMGAMPARRMSAAEPRRGLEDRQQERIASSKSHTMKLTLSTHELKTRHPFTISRGTTTTKTTMIVELEQDGIRGYGEAVQHSFYGITIENMTSALEGVRSLVEGRPIDDPAALWKELDPKLSSNRFAQNALDQAAWDLYGKLRGFPVWKMWGLSLDHCPPTDYTIGIDSIDKMVAKLHEMPGFPVYKVKLGTDNDLEIMQALRKATDAVFRIDANCGWTVDEAIEKSYALKELGVEFIEQPLPRDAWKEMPKVYRESALPVIADESSQTEEDVARCDGLFHGINVKIAKAGGLTPGKRMLEDARRRGMKTMIGCFTESSVGISAIAQLLPLVDYADLDGILLIANDIATGVTIDRGKITFPKENGTGVRLLQ